jgi:hypothetical protein
MAEATAQDAQQGQTQQEQPQTVQTEASDSHETDWKAEARKWEARAKENKSKADKLDEIEEASKSALEKAQERAQKAENRVKEFEAEAQRKQWLDEVAKETGLPAGVLRGNTREEIEVHAQSLKPYFEKTSAPIVRSDDMKSNTQKVGKTKADQLMEMLQPKFKN